MITEIKWTGNQQDSELKTSSGHLQLIPLNPYIFQELNI